MASFGTDAKNKIMVSRDSELGDNSLVLEAISDRFVKYFKCVLLVFHVANATDQIGSRSFDFRNLPWL